MSCLPGAGGQSPTLVRDHFHVLSQIRRGGLTWWPGGRYYSNAYFYPLQVSAPLLAHHFASNLIAPVILKEERPSTFSRRLLSHSRIPPILPYTEFPEHAPRPEL